MIYLLSGVVFYLLVNVLFGIGRRALSFSGFSFASKSEEFSFSYAIGFAIFSYLILLIGVLGSLYKEAIVICLILSALAVRRDIAYLNKEAYLGLAGILKGGFKAKSIFLGLFILVAIVMIGSMAPSFSNDSMVYHLTDAKYFANTHTVGPILYNSVNSLWPYLVEMYFTMAVSLGLLPLAGLIHFSLAFVSMAAIYAFGKRFLDERTGLLAAAAFILTPAIFTEAAQTYVDLGVVAYSFLAVYACIVWLENRSLKWAALSGLMCGFGMSVKYFALLTALILAGFFFFNMAAGKGGRARLFKSLLLFCAFAFIASCFWYIRQFIVFKNPFFPFFYKIFGSGGLDREAIMAIAEEGIRSSQSTYTGIKDFLLFPWRLTMSPQRFGGPVWGPVFLSLIPCIVFIRPVDKNIRRLLLFAFVFAAIWFWQYQNSRFLLSIVPGLCLAASYVLNAILSKKGPANKAIWTLAGLWFAFSLLFMAYHNLGRMKVVFGLQDKGSYLAANERSFEASEYINKNLPKDASIIVLNEGHTFFIDRPNRRELYYWIYTRYDKKYKSASEIISFFRAEGFTYLLYAEARRGLGDRRLAVFIREATGAGYLKEVSVNRPRSVNAGGVIYRLYEIQPRGAGL